MEIVVSVVVALGKCIAAPACNYADRCRRFKHDVNDLKERIKDLNNRKEDIETELRSAVAVSGKVVRKQVNNWLKDVERVNGEIAMIENEAENISCFLRTRRGKLVREKIAQVERISQRGSFSEGLVIDEPAAAGMKLPIEELEGEIDVKEQIWECVGNDEIGIIGLYGIGGVGKTSIMKHINNELLKESRGFTKVMWITVSHPLNVRRLQCAIAEKMGNKLPEDREELDLASDLMRMMEGVKYALILDDVWDKFALERVGIPKPTRENGCKVLVTTRSTEVCNYFGCHMIKVKPLSEQESMNLFLDRVGRDVALDRDLLEVIELVVKECSGLPLAIVVIAASMKGVRDIHEWRDALRELRNCVAGTLKDSEDEIFSRLKFSYDRLRDLEIQNCFLHFSLYPEDYEISSKDLIEAWVDEGIMRELGSRQQMEDKAHTIIHKLENNCLFETNVYGSYYKMHDVVRDMALRIKSSSCVVMVKGRMGLTEMPAGDEWSEDLENVFLMNNDLTHIPPNVSPKCPILSTLRLEYNHKLGQIPECFFQHMVGLKCINLRGTRIVALPNSICNLENLTSLILHFCRDLKHVPSLAKLKALKKLDLYKAGIEVLPEGLETLVNLQYLDLYFPSLVEGLPSGMLFNLSRLQYLGVCYKISSSNPRMTPIGEEIAMLRKLEKLKALFFNLQDLKGYVNNISYHFKGPSKYLLVLGACSKFINSPVLSRSALIQECEIEGEDSLVLPDNLLELEIRKCRKAKSCRVSKYGGLEYIFDLASPSSSSISKLQSLCLIGLSNLRALVKFEAIGSLSTTCHPTILSFFSNLKKLEIYSCSSMKKLFPFELLMSLQNLQAIVVEDCEEMEEIWPQGGGGGGNHATTTFNLPNLQRLRLEDLPAVRSICPEGVVIVCDSLEEISISKCPELKRIPLVGKKQPFPPALKRIKIDSEEGWDSLEWDDPNVKHALQPFTEFAMQKEEK